MATCATPTQARGNSPSGVMQCLAPDVQALRRVDLCTTALGATTLDKEQRVEVLKARAGAWADLRQWSNALQDLEAALALGAPPAPIHAERATMLLFLGEHVLARDALLAANAADPQDKTRFLKFAEYLLYRQRDFAAARLYLDAILNLEPTHATASLNRAYSFHYSGQHTEALAALDRILADRPDWAPAVLGRGIIQADIGNYDAAQAAFLQVLIADPDNDDAYYQRGLTFFRMGRFSDAAQTLSSLPSDDLYGAIWHFIAWGRAGQNARPVLETSTDTLKPGVWPAPIIEMLLGKLSPNELIDAAEDNDPVIARNQLCQAHFFIGQNFILKGNTETARLAFRNTVALGLIEYVEHRTAQIELGRLGH